MPEIESMSLILSQEEVVYMLALLQARFIPGLGPAPLGEATDEEARAALVAAERSLIARRYITVNSDGPRQVAGLVVGLVGICAYPNKSLLLNREAADGSTTTAYFHIAEEGVTVEHEVPQNGIHQFTAYANTQDALARLVELLGLRDQPAPVGASGKLDQNALAIAAEQVARGAHGQALRFLTEQGLNASGGAALVAGLAQVIARVGLISVDHDPEESQLSEYSLLISTAGYWLLEPSSPGQGARLTIRPIAGADLRQWLAHHLTPALRPVAS